MTPMELEFKNLANVKAEPSRFVSANLQVVSMTTQTSFQKDEKVQQLPCQYSPPDDNDDNDDDNHDEYY